MSGPRIARSFLLAGLIGLAPAYAEARPNDELEEAQKAYNELRFEPALELLEKALAFPNTYQDLVAIYQLRGLTYAALNQPAAAREAFTYLLVIDPDHTLPDYAAPRMRRPLKDARARLGPNGKLTARIDAPSDVDAKASPVVDVVLVNDPLGLVDRVRVDYRLAGAAKAHSATELAGPKVSVRLDVNAAGAGDAIEVWATLLDRNGGELHFVHSAEEPLRIGRTGAVPVVAITPTTPLDSVPTVAEEGEAPVWKRWWFWTVVGVAAVGVAGGVTWALWPSAPECPAGTDCSYSLPR